MKKLLLLFIICCLLVGCASSSQTEPETTDAQKFKEEYESHNGEYDEKRGHDYIEVLIDEDNPMVYGTEQDVFRLIDEESSGIIYFGFPECPWCRTLIPYLLEALKDAQIDRVYYVNNYDTRDIKELDENGNVVVKQEGSEDYYKLLDCLGEWAPVYSGLEDDSIKHLYYPTVLYIKNGNIVGLHTGTVESQTDVWTSLTEEQIDELKADLADEIKLVYSSGCSISQPACD